MMIAWVDLIYTTGCAKKVYGKFQIQIRALIQKRYCSISFLKKVVSYYY